MFYRFWVAMFFSSLMLSAHEPRVVSLTPPQISKETLSEKIVCTRPMRNGKFNISLEQQPEKMVVHCYGHGGSGWTTLFGSVNRAIALFQATQPDLNTPIRVIGSGCMGLTTAIELTRLGYRVSGISTENLYDLPSWRAAGYFALVSVKTSPEEQANLDAIGLDTFLTYQRIDQGEHPYLSKEAVKYMPVYCSADTDAGLEGLEASGMIPPKEPVSLDFGNGVIHPDYVEYMTYFMNTTTLMRQLTLEIERLKIPVKLEKVESFGDLKEEVIFNCAGLGGRELNGDADMIAVRGHLVTLNQQAGSGHMEYMIYTKLEEGYVYLFPKDVSVTPEQIDGAPCVGVLGGTFIPDVDKMSLAEQEELDQAEFKRLLDRNSEFFLGHPFGE
jgi:hypothetical protein